MSTEERYLTYLQLKSRESDASVRYCWSPELISLVDEFDMQQNWDLDAGGF